MKKIIMLVMLVMSLCIAANAQKPVKREGKTFSYEQTEKKSNVMQTEFQWQDSKGTTYPIWVNQSSGRCYVLKVSSKTGNEYKYYLNEEIARQICSELGIEYKEKSGGNK